MLDLPPQELAQQQAHVIRQQRRLEDAAWLATLRNAQQHNEHKENLHGQDQDQRVVRPST